MLLLAVIPIGEPTPWKTLLNAWTMPLFWWLSFIWTLYFVCFCIVVILRKQWVERERLAYPLMEVPQMLVANADRGLPAILRSKLFWTGAAIPLSIVIWNIFGFFFHFFPQISWDYPIQTIHAFPSINIRLYFPVVGFMYFANLNVSFSIWFFFLLTGISLFVLRKKDRDIPRVYKVPAFPIPPILFCGMCIYMLWSSVAYAGTMTLVWILPLLAALPLYVIGRRRPTRNETDQQGHH